MIVDINENGLAELDRDLRSTKGMYVIGQQNVIFGGIGYEQICAFVDTEF